MPRLRDVSLPSVLLSMSDEDIKDYAKKLEEAKLSPESMVEAIVYLKREREKADALKAMEDVLRARLKAYYDKRKADERESVRSEVGFATYSKPSEKVSLKDRDATVASLTDEQLRISYVPDLKALQTILKPDHFERLVKRETREPVLTVKENKGAEGYEELDFEDF